MMEAIRRLLESRGHQVATYFRSSLELRAQRLGPFKAFFSGIYNVPSQRRMAKFIAAESPDCVLAQNVFPLLSPSILVACRKAGIPVLMRCPNYRLICPNGKFMTGGQICERCAGGKEYWCALRNCEQNVFKSAGYALRSMIARQMALFKNNVDVFLVLTHFARQKLIDNGFAPERVQVLSALADPTSFQPKPSLDPGSYIGFVGRVTPEKGIHQLIEVARSLPYIPFKIAGQLQHQSKPLSHMPNNVEILGQLTHQQLQHFYHSSRIIVTPSQWYEGLPVVILEAMLSAKPVICSRIGGLSEVVDDERTGLLFKHDSIIDLQNKIRLLWEHPEMCRNLGLLGREKAISKYSPDEFYKTLIKSYRSIFKIKKET